MPKVHYDVADLRALGEIARTGTFGRAAEALSITQSALSRRIAKLEAAVGGDLVARSTRSLALTTIGRQLLQRAAPLLDGLDESVNEASRVARGLEGQIVLGCISSIAYTRLPEIVAHFRRDHAEVGLLLQDRSGPEVNHALTRREVELAITTFQTEPEGFTVEPLTVDPFVAVCSPAHALTGDGPLTWSALSQHNLIGFKASSSTRRQIDEVLSRSGIELKWFDEVEQLSSLIGFLTSGRFVGVVPRLLAERLPNLAVMPIDGFRIERTIFVARRRDSALSIPAMALWRSIVTTIGDGAVRPSSVTEIP